MTKELQKKEVLNIAKTQFVMQLATCKDNEPAIAVMEFATDDDFNIYFATHRGSRKAQNLFANPKAAIAIGIRGQMLLQISADVEEITDEKEKEEAMDRLADQMAHPGDFWPPVFRINDGGYALFKAKPTWMRSLDLSRNTIGQEDSPFTEIAL